ncbi:MAG: DUF1538 domain-containing protein [Christensenellaceae bacterium]|jgi:hypothetical protein|nr:DUF1538 domain-containing protein [Christensenellaceae bacterium]
MRLLSNTVIKEKFIEALRSVLPITVIVLLLCFSITPIDSGALLAFLFGAALLVVGTALFSLGTETAMMPMGESIGTQMTKSRSIVIVALVSFFMGLTITISEPDLQVLANQVPMIPNMILIGSVGLGVGLFLVVALLRILFGIPLAKLLVGFYILIFLLVPFVPKSFLAVAFDSGGVTTGPMTVPFILALGIGVAAIRADRQAENDSFGLVALGSIGPILAVLILGMMFRAEEASFIPIALPKTAQSTEMAWSFLEEFPHYFNEMAMALLPIVVFFYIYQAFTIRLSLRRQVRLFVGVLYTYLGLVLFLTGVNVGFMPVGNLVGQLLGALPYRWIVVPIGMVMGYFIVQAEPAVHVLNQQVEEITSGAISRRALGQSLSIAIAFSIGLAMIRVLSGISILWFLIPGYTIALVMAFFVPGIFTSIAFDSGGVASGPMTATFLLPLSMGVCEALGGNVVSDAFGVVAMVAMMPLITIQITGLIYARKQRAEQPEPEAPDEIIEAEETLGADEDIIEL